MLVSQQYRAWSDCTDVQTGLALYWWQRLISFGVGRIRVKWINPPSGTIHYHFGLVVGDRWQRFVIFGSSRIGIKYTLIDSIEKKTRP